MKGTKTVLTVLASMTGGALATAASLKMSTKNITKTAGLLGKTTVKMTNRTKAVGLTTAMISGVTGVVAAVANKEEVVNFGHKTLSAVKDVPGKVKGVLTKGKQVAEIVEEVVE